MIPLPNALQDTASGTVDAQRGPIYVLASAIGESGGAAKATRLLGESLATLGTRVHLFVTHPPQPATYSRLRARAISVTSAWFNRGHRFELPQRLIARQLALAATANRARCIISVSLSAEARHLLTMLPPVPIYLWESTEALPHVGFVDQRIHRYLHHARAILAPSHRIAANIRQTYGYRGVIRQLPFWAEPAPPHPVPPTPRSFNLLYVGRLDPDKGLAYLFDAFRQLHACFPQARLTVCGRGADALVQSLAAAHPAIHFKGYISAEQYEKEVRRSDAIVLPSLHEGYPLSLLEACARSKPVITTAVGSIPEVFGQHPAAWIVPPGDSAALLDAMRQLFSESPEQYQARCQAAFELFQRVSSPAVVRQRLCDLLSPSAARQQPVPDSAPRD